MPIYEYTRQVTRPPSEYSSAFVKYLGRPWTTGEWMALNSTAPSGNVRINILGSETGQQVEAVLDQITPYGLVGTSDKTPGPDGIPEAQGDGADVHTITIYKKNTLTGETVSGTEVVRAVPNQMIPVNPRLVQLVAGVGRLSVGPSMMPGTVSLEFRDQAGNLMSGRLTVRFI